MGKGKHLLQIPVCFVWRCFSERMWTLFRKAIVLALHAMKDIRFKRKLYSAILGSWKEEIGDSFWRCEFETCRNARVCFCFKLTHNITLSRLALNRNRLSLRWPYLKIGCSISEILNCHLQSLCWHKISRGGPRPHPIPLISSGELGPIQTPYFFMRLTKVKSSVSESSIKNRYFNLERLSHSSRLEFWL